MTSIDYINIIQNANDNNSKYEYNIGKNQSNQSYDLWTTSWGNFKK